MVQKFGFECLKLEHFSDSPGVINNIYFLECSDGKSYVLKVNNPRFIRIKTLNEVRAMKMIKNKSTTFRIPSVLDYSIDKDTSPIG